MIDMRAWDEVLAGLGEARGQVDPAALDGWVTDVVRTLTDCRNADDFTPLAHVFAPELLHQVQSYDAAEKASGREQRLLVQDVTLTPVGALVREDAVTVRVRVLVHLLGDGDPQLQREVWTLSTPLTGRVLAAGGRCTNCGAARPAASGACLWCGTLLTVAGEDRPWQVVGRQSS